MPNQPAGAGAADWSGPLSVAAPVQPSGEVTAGSGRRIRPQAFAAAPPRQAGAPASQAGRGYGQPPLPWQRARQPLRLATGSAQRPPPAAGARLSGWPRAPHSPLPQQRARQSLRRAAGFAQPPSRPGLPGEAGFDIRLIQNAGAASNDTSMSFEAAPVLLVSDSAFDASDAIRGMSSIFHRPLPGPGFVGAREDD